MISWLLSHPGVMAPTLLAAIVTMLIVEPSLHRFAGDCDEWFDERGISPAPLITIVSAIGVAVGICLLWVMW